MRKIMPVILLLLVFSAACFTVGWNFPADRVKEIEIGKTTKADLLGMFGQPYQRGIEDGQETWTYIWIRYGRKTMSKEMHVKFLQNDLVDSYSFSSSLPKEEW